MRLRPLALGLLAGLGITFVILARPSLTQSPPDTTLAHGVAALKTATQTLLELVPLGMMLPYFGNELPPNGYFVWADGQAPWPDRDWVPEHLRGQPVPDMRERFLIGGAGDPLEVGIVSEGGAITIPNKNVEGSSFEAPRLTTAERSWLSLALLRRFSEPSCASGLGIQWTCRSQVLGTGAPDGTRIGLNQLVTSAPLLSGVVTVTTPELLEAELKTETIKMLTDSDNAIGGQADISFEPIEIGSDQRPPTLQARWIIRVK